MALFHPDCRRSLSLIVGGHQPQPQSEAYQQQTNDGIAQRQKLSQAPSSPPYL
jgi:hypothetical protein